jgi:hypothetical protein
LDLIAAPLFGRIASDVGRPHDLLGCVRLFDVNQPDAYADVERAAIPDKPQLLHAKSEAFGNLQRISAVAMLQKNAKLVAAQSREEITSLKATLQRVGRLPQQCVARGVTAGIIDDFELIEIEKHQGVLAARASKPVKAVFEIGFELAAIGESG